MSSLISAIIIALAIYLIGLAIGFLIWGNESNE